MALTQTQQELQDVAQAGEANACCLALGNTIVTDPVSGQELCGTSSGMFGGETTNTFPLSDACSTAAQAAGGLPSPGQNQGGFFNWLGNNFETVTGGVANIINAVQGDTLTTPGSVPPGTSPVVGTQNDNTKPDNTLLYIVGGVVLLLVVVLIIRKK